MKNTFEYVVSAQDVGQRLDTWLGQQHPDFSRSQIQRRIDCGEVRVDGGVPKPGQKLRPGQRVVFAPSAVRMTSDVPEDIPLDILYEDAHLIVVNKPAGMVVHPAPGHGSGTLVHALLFHCGPLPVPVYVSENELDSSEEDSPALAIGGEYRPGIVHRLDQGTSGVLVCAKDEKTLRDLQTQFQQHTIQRRYWALVEGAVHERGSFRTRYGRHPNDGKRFTARRGNKHAVTHYRVLQPFQDASLVEVSLETGRTHQIRVHFSEAGHPVLGDPLYGRAPTQVPLPLRKAVSLIAHQALHAQTLGFVHPFSGATLIFSAPPPADFMAVMEALPPLKNT